VPVATDADLWFVNTLAKDETIENLKVGEWDEIG